MIRDNDCWEVIRISSFGLWGHRDRLGLFSPGSPSAARFSGVGCESQKGRGAGGQGGEGEGAGRGHPQDTREGRTRACSGT